MKRILVACGNGIATSTVVATKIREKCEDNGIPVSVTQCKLLGWNPRRMILICWLPQESLRAAM